MDTADVLFVAQTGDASCYHRIMLPALALGCDWCGLEEPPPRMVVGRGQVRFADGLPDLASYRAVVLQTPAHPGWLDVIVRLQGGGTRVLYEVDYDLHAFDQSPEAIGVIETLVSLSDGVICATERIAERYRPLNPHVYVCESGIDLAAYELTRPAHNTVNLGWAGRTLTPDEMRIWLAQVGGVMRAREITNFISLGEPYADQIAASGVVAPERCLAIPTMLPEQYPAPLSMVDILFDPMGRQPWRRARSALRWFEAAAFAIPFVGDRRIYPQLEHGRTGFHVATPDQLGTTLAQLVDDPDLRATVGAAARAVVEEHHTMAAVAPRWLDALERVAA